MLLKPAAVSLMLLPLTGCLQNSRDIQNLNNSIYQTQRTVDYANKVYQTPSSEKKRALKNAGKQVIERNPNYQQSQETIRATKELGKSIRAFGQTVPQQ